MIGRTLTDSNVSLGAGVAAVVGGTVRSVGRPAADAASTPFAVYGKSATSEADEVGNTLQNDQQSKPLTP